MPEKAVTEESHSGSTRERRPVVFTFFVSKTDRSFLENELEMTPLCLASERRVGAACQSFFGSPCIPFVLNGFSVSGCGWGMKNYAFSAQSENALFRIFSAQLLTGRPLSSNGIYRQTSYKVVQKRTGQTAPTRRSLAKRSGVIHFELILKKRPC
ncbi:hypothetical protein L596_019964 [Steinernema carpocapsae]|uniref:Uncharacterized protein n=1 Tax=Steinernema carpocapsae TaxID=34508 RepID=A0A4U5MS62_STECR|nr:hypothetical protein L596_019964 [Steinernema carpocapsae]